MIKARCYYVTGLWRYYRTIDGETFSIRDNKDYFYHGNVFENQDIIIYIKNVEKLKQKVSFIDN